MRRGVTLVVAACVALLVSSAAAFAKNDDGVGGGGGWARTPSGLYVPPDHAAPKSAPAIPPAVGQFGQGVAKDVAKDVVKGGITIVAVSAWGKLKGAARAVAHAVVRMPAPSSHGYMSSK